MLALINMLQATAADGACSQVRVGTLGKRSGSCVSKKRTLGIRHMGKFALLILTLCASSARAATISHQRLDSGTELILIIGKIQSGDEAAFTKLAIQFDKAVVGLSSNGGALLPALDIGTALHIRGFETAVVAGDQCASACALIWAGGVTRYLVKGGRVGFHASYVDDGGKSVETGLGNALVGRYLTQIGFSERAVVFATASHPDSIAWLEQERDAATSGFAFNFSVSANKQADASKTAPPIVGPHSAPNDAGEAAFMAGWELWNAKRFDQAITELRAMAANFPGHRRVSWANNLVGRALLDKGQPRAAAEALLANYRGNPSGERAPDSLFYLGQSLEKLNQASQACKAYAELTDVYGATLRPALAEMVPLAKARAGCK
jgi:tetratricopeptide (TPR) repeat protein